MYDYSITTSNKDKGEEMSSKYRLMVSSIAILMVLVMGYAFEVNAFANYIDPVDNLPVIVQTFSMNQLIPVLA